MLDLVLVGESAENWSAAHLGFGLGWGKLCQRAVQAVRVKVHYVLGQYGTLALSDRLARADLMYRPETCGARILDG
jgi:hypothetical protein